MIKMEQNDCLITLILNYKVYLIDRLYKIVLLIPLREKTRWRNFTRSAYFMRLNVKISEFLTINFNGLYSLSLLKDCVYIIYAKFLLTFVQICILRFKVFLLPSLCCDLIVIRDISWFYRQTSRDIFIVEWLARTFLACDL